MADPLSIIAGIISVATAAIQSSKTLSALITDIKEASEEIKVVSRDLFAFESIVSSLKLELEETEFKEAIGGDHAMIEMIGNLHYPLGNSEAALRVLSSKLSTELEFRKGRRFRATTVRLKWALFAKNEAKDLQSRLGVTKATLSAALNAINTLCTMRIMAAIRNAHWRGSSSNISFAVGHSLRGGIHEIRGPANSPVRAIESHKTTLSPEPEIENAQTPVLYNDEHGHTDHPLDSYLAQICLQSNNHSNQINREREDGASKLISDDEVESSLDDFFDCVSRFSDNDSIKVLEDFQSKLTGSPNPYFESRVLFCPEEYTLDSLFDERIFVSAMIQSQEDERAQKYFIDFAYEPRKWRSVVVLAAPQTRWTQLPLPYSIIHIGFGMRKKLPRAIYQSLRKLLPTLDLFDSVTRITLPFYQDNSDRIVVDLDELEMAEDETEIAMCCEDQIMLDIKDLDCVQFVESNIVTQYHISSPYFVVWVESQSCIERKAPFPGAGLQDGNSFQDFCNDLKLHHSLRGCSGVIQFIGIVLDDRRRHLKSFLYESFSTNIGAIFESAAHQGEIIPWQIREAWARQIVTAVCEVHKKNVAPILVSSYTINIRADGSALIMPRSPRPSDKSNGHLAPELRESGPKKGLQEISKFRTDIFRLGLILWQLAEHQDILSNYFCSKYGCTKMPRCACKAPHSDPIELPECSAGVPAYFSKMIKLCRSRDPKDRPSARQLLDSFPCETVLRTQEPTVHEIVQKFPPLEYSAVCCDECGARIMKTYYPFNVCVNGDFDLCPALHGKSISVAECQTI